VFDPVERQQECDDRVVVACLVDDPPAAMTATELAYRTGLGRASVSTTLSKLAKSGEVSILGR